MKDACWLFWKVAAGSQDVNAELLELPAAGTLLGTPTATGSDEPGLFRLCVGQNDRCRASCLGVWPNLI